MSVINLARKDEQPFAQIPNAAIRDPNITPNAFRLLAYLMSHKDGYELNYDQIEAQTGLGRYAINEASKLLVALKWLEVNRPKVDGKYACKQWVVLNPYANESTVGDSTMERSHMGQSTDNIRTSITKEEQLLRTNAQNEFEPLFEDFWLAYPRKVGKEAARKAFEKAPVDSWRIIEGAKRLSADPYLPAKQFVPYPATWLNRAGWDDEPYPPREKTKEEIAAEIADRNARQRELSKQASEERRREEEEARKRMAPPPTCQHGISIIKCRKCLLGLN
jgi:hypothetical protein